MTNVAYEWQPVATAPKGHTILLGSLYGSRWSYFVGYRSDDEFFTEDGEWRDRVEAWKHIDTPRLSLLEPTP